MDTAVFVSFRLLCKYLDRAARAACCIGRIEVCDDAELLEKALRAYQGRALYEGALSDDVLAPLVEKYGLII